MTVALRTLQVAKAFQVWASVSAVVFSFALFFPKAAFAEGQMKCSQKRLDSMVTESENIRDWAKLQAFYHRYLLCDVDDAEVATGVSDIVVYLLLNHWELLPDAERIFRRDPPFESFALAGINITDDTADLTRIDRLAEHQCPKNSGQLCMKIRRAVRENK